MKKKLILAVLASVAVIGLGAAGAGVGYMYSTLKQYTNVIFPKVIVEDVNLTGKSKIEALQLLNNKYGDSILGRKINIDGQSKSYTIDFDKLDARYNVEEAVNGAFQYGRESNIIKQYMIIKNPEVKRINLDFSYDPKPVKELIAEIEKDINREPVNAELKTNSSGNFTVVPEVTGARLNIDKLEKDINKAITNSVSGEGRVQVEIENVQASVTRDMLEKINTKISSFSTSFAGSSENRISNISLATRSINGKLLMPGDSFSFNDVVGERTIEKGYKEAPVIINNKLDSGLGGGICQVSTTLFNAVVRANMESTERIHHSLPSHYIGLGMDATVDYGRLDYKFRNNLQYPVYIEGFTRGKTIGFNIYSDKSLLGKTYDLVSEVYDTVKAAVKFIDEPSMYEGETEVVQKPSDGYKVKVYKKIFENGSLIKQELVSSETYKRIDGITKKGTKKRPNNTADSNSVKDKPAVPASNTTKPEAPTVPVSNTSKPETSPVNGTENTKTN